MASSIPPRAVMTKSVRFEMNFECGLALDTSLFCCMSYVSVTMKTIPLLNSENFYVI